MVTLVLVMRALTLECHTFAGSQHPSELGVVGYSGLVLSEQTGTVSDIPFYYFSIVMLWMVQLSVEMSLLALPWAKVE